MRLAAASRILAFVVAALVATPALAVCFSNSDCPGNAFGGIRSCNKSKVFGWDLFFGTCSRPGVCNSDADCTNSGVCLTGTCQAPGSTAGSGGGAPSKGSGIPGEGRHCMPADGSRPADWAKDDKGKPLGACPSGTRCSDKGFCIRLET